ncbi:hypothetical protein HHK36_008223 [Tetracentron sinense]|uniref:RING-type E3 ubiquitin transferase n=1 Tax=Tetracentron sinense TaxID=13715 RepID=A0A835DJ46_TETSI|nr:hypothetical protein HHK36_008223 [Tetracentron sinense]
MGTGWRRAFCTSIPRDPDSTVVEKQKRCSSSSSSSSPTRSCSRLGFLSGGSLPSTPRLRCHTTTESPRLFQTSNPSSPRSPSKFSLLKNTLRLSRSSCGICLQSVKTGQGTAIFTAECSHSFHFPCIAAHVRKHGSLVCPVCTVSWKEVPLLAMHKNQQPETRKEEEPSLRDLKTKQDHQQSKSSNSRVYNDDEPLLSPIAGPRFNPIPEADENGEKDEPGDHQIEEFQGFFVNPNHSSSGRALRNVEIRLLPETAVISVGRNHKKYVVALKVKAPPPPARNSTTAPLLDSAKRAPVDLVTVLDIGGSMTGPKLQMLKRAMRLVISSLGSADRLAIVAFSANPKRLLPLRRMTADGQRNARRIIDRLVSGQGTSVGDALRKASKVLEDRRERNPVASIMLLSDGQDERVPTNSANRRRPSAHESSTRFAHLEIPVQSFGFGENGGKSHELAEDAFAKCVGGLLSVVVKDLRLQLGSYSGSAPAEISAVYSCTGRPTVLGSGSIRIGDLYAEEERDLLVELRVPSSAVRADDHVMSVRCCYKDPATQELISGEEQALLVPPPQVVRSSLPKIERLRNFFVTTRAVAESWLLIEHNDLSRAHHLLCSARTLLMQSSSISADEYLRSLEVELAELHCRRQQQIQRRRTTKREPAYLEESGELITPTSAWRAAERLAKVAIMRKSLNRVSDLHGFENARF